MENYARLVQIKADANCNATTGVYLLRNYPYSYASDAAHIYCRRAAHGFRLLAAAWQNGPQERPGHPESTRSSGRRRRAERA